MKFDTVVCLDVLEHLADPASQLEVFNKIKKEYENSPNTFGSSSGKKESVMELLVIVGNQIAGEYKDCEVTIKQGVPEINKIKSQ